MNKIPLAGVIGSPIAHSKSPDLHGFWLRDYAIKGHYIPIDVPQGELAETLARLARIGFVGANVTIPYKEEALKIADDVSDHAKRIGAANTLVFSPDGKIYADNTDGYGFIENLRQNAPDWDPTSGPALVLGAGGASRAILVALLDAGVPKILLSNRTKERANVLAHEFGPKIEVIDWAPLTHTLPDCAMVVNTTSLGMTGYPALEIAVETLPQTALVTDIVYAPLKTDLLKRAEAHGCTSVDGLGMLLHQAVPGFERWFGKTPDVTDALRAAVLA